MEEVQLSIRLEQQIRALVAGLDSEDAHNGLSASDWRVLRQIEAGEGSCLKQIASRAGVTLSSASRKMQKLATRGLVTWDRLPGNQRTYAIYATALGREVVGQANQRSRPGARAALQRLSSEDLRAVTAILDECVER